MRTRVQRARGFGIALGWMLVAALPARGADSPDGTTPLHDAVYRDRTVFAKRLLTEGADANATNRYGVNTLSLACQNGNTALVKALLEAGADPNAALSGGETALMTAARTGKPGPVRLLLDSGAAVDARDRKNQTALMWAAAEGHAKVMTQLIAAGADPAETLKSGFTPLLFAVRGGHVEAAKVVLAAGVDVNTATGKAGKSGTALPEGSSALRVAVENGHFELAVMLLKAGADPDDQRSGYAPLHVLTWVRKPNRGDSTDGLPPPEGSGDMTSLEFARVLVEDFGADVNLRLREGTSGGAKFGTASATPFLLAAQKADLPYLQLLAELGADPALPNKDGTTPLLAAAGVGSRAPEEEAGTDRERVATLDWLHERGAEVNAVDKNGETAMHGAAYKNVPGVVAWLAAHGAEVATWNMKNKRGWTPLLIAQGFRPGNFKPDAATIAAIEKEMRAKGIEPPPAPKRPLVGKPKKYEP